MCSSVGTVTEWEPAASEAEAVIVQMSGGGCEWGGSRWRWEEKCGPWVERYDTQINQCCWVLFLFFLRYKVNLTSVLLTSAVPLDSGFNTRSWAGVWWRYIKWLKKKTADFGRKTSQQSDKNGTLNQWFYARPDNQTRGIQRGAVGSKWIVFYSKRVE